jgi:hypothetical protein
LKQLFGFSLQQHPSSENIIPRQKEQGTNLDKVIRIPTL